MAMSRNERIENYYQQSAWDLAEWLVDAEDKVQFLYCLQAAGVDNWEGYDLACQLNNSDPDEEDI